jgi:HAD superfamily hydrolase (TIGR01509 family)
MGSRVNALILDLDGTLVDSSIAHFRAWKSALQEIGVKLDPASFEHVSGLDSISAARILLCHKTDLERETVIQRKNEKFRESLIYIRPCPGARELVLFARTSGVKTGVVTSASEDDLKSICKNVLDMYDLFDSLLSVESVGKPKPDPALLLQTLEYLKSTPESSIYVGDAVVDIVMARRVGISSIGISNRSEKQKRMIEAGAACIAIDLKQVASILSNWKHPFTR